MNEKTQKIETYKFKDLQSFKAALDKAPQPNWCKKRTAGNYESIYMPLFRQQALADIMFREWLVIDEKYGTILNEVQCTVKIQALPDYPDAEHWFFTGSASKPIQCDANSTASKFPIGKKSNALEYNLPAVRGAAMSTAFSTIGNVFGRNLARETNNNYSLTKEKKKEEDAK